MKLRTMMAGAGALALAAAATTARAQVAVSGDPVLYWNQLATQTIGGDPGLGGRSYAIMDIAVHDAVNATVGSPDHSYVGGVTTFGGDTRAAAAVAAHDVLVNLNPSSAAQYDAALTASLALIPNGAAKSAGMSTGQAYASAALSSRASDGWNATPPPYVPTGEPGNYVPTVPGPPNSPIDGQFGTATPFVLTSDSQFRPGAPPTLTSAAYAAAYNDVKSLGSATSTSRTADETFSARFWENNPETPYLTAAITQSVAAGKSVLENARIFATLTTAIADAPIVSFDAKDTYEFWRPVTAIQQGDLDGNAATVGDPNWQPLLVTPPFSSYDSAHSTVAGTAASVLDAEYGSAIGFCFTNALGQRCWDSYDAAALDDSSSRLWGGVHFGFDDQVGLSTGYQLGAFAVGRDLFGAVPEPTSWAMMIAGFGLAGAGLRRRRSLGLAYSA